MLADTLALNGGTIRSATNLNATLAHAGLDHDPNHKVDWQANRPATGLPTITGTAQVGETLAADTSSISDADGLTNATFTYQWLADDADISGATSSSYTLAAADEGKAVKVRVSFTDDASHDETLTSAATAAVAPRPNSPASGLPTITGTAQVGETLAADTSGISDADGLTNATFTYQWLADDADLSGATSSSYTLAAADEGKAVKVRVSFTDDAGHDETLTSAATAAVAAATAPEVTGVAVSSTPASADTYGSGETIRVTLTLSEAVDVTGAPRLKIDMDPAYWGEKWAAYESGNRHDAKLAFDPRGGRAEPLHPGHRRAGQHAGAERRRHQIDRHGGGRRPVAHGARPRRQPQGGLASEQPGHARIVAGHHIGQRHRPSGGRGGDPDRGHLQPSHPGTALRTDGSWARAPEG